MDLKREDAVANAKDNDLWLALMYDLVRSSHPGGQSEIINSDYGDQIGRVHKISIFENNFMLLIEVSYFVNERIVKVFRYKPSKIGVAKYDGDTHKIDASGQPASEIRTGIIRAIKKIKMEARLSQ